MSMDKNSNVIILQPRKMYFPRPYLIVCDCVRTQTRYTGEESEKLEKQDHRIYPGRII
jgi:hypothetical protein